MTKKLPLACRQHDHRHCIDSALAAARAHCQSSGSRLTAIREDVLKLIWQSHKPLGAYALMDMLAAESTRRVAPPTVYRALDFLLEQNLIHRIHSLNAFIGCTHPGHGHPDNFLICSECGIAVEFNNRHFEAPIQQVSQESGFSIRHQSIELVGLCNHCRSHEHG